MNCWKIAGRARAKIAALHERTGILRLERESIPATFEAARTAADITVLWQPVLDPLFWRPERLGTQSTWLGHVPFAFWLTTALGPRRIVEVGTCEGVSYSAFCQAVERSQLGCQCFGVNIRETDEQQVDNPLFSEFKQFHDERYSAFSSLRRQTFDSAMEHFVDGSIDLLHINGVCQPDAERYLAAWKPKLSDRAVVLMRGCGVDTGSAARANGPTFEFLHSGGLLVLAAGPQVTGIVLELCSLTSPPEIAAVRERFAFAGSRWVSELWAIRERDLESQLQLAKERAGFLESKLQRIDLTHRQALTGAQSEIYRYSESLKLAVETARRLNTRLGENLDLALHSNKELNRKLAEIQGSVGWALTSPLRYLDAKIPRLGLYGRRAAKSLTWAVSSPAAKRTRTRPWTKLDVSVIEESGLFDADWYLRRNPDAVQSGSNLIAHYLTVGLQQGAKPNPVFDRDWYLSQNPDVAASGIDPLIHYITVGSSENRQPHPLFDCGWYRRQYPDVVQAGQDPLAHYLANGSKEGRFPNPLFDPRWYREKNPEISALGLEPLAHFYEFGSNEGRRPVPLFDAAWYRAESPDVVSSGAEALAHYLHFGWKEGRRPSGLFDSNWYLAEYPDVEASGAEPLGHYLHFGSAEDRKPNALFTPSWYRSQHLRVAFGKAEPLSHYVVDGEREGLSPIPAFDPLWYEAANPDVGVSGLGAFGHYLLFGKSERRAPVPDWLTKRRQRRIEALGLSVLLAAKTLAIGIVTYNNEASQLDRCVRSASIAFQMSGLNPRILLIDNGQPSEISSAVEGNIQKLVTRGNIGFGAAHNLLMKQAFEEGAEYYVAANPDGAFEPLSIEALLKMEQAANGEALIEATQFPEEHPKIYADDDFETPWASGACLLIPRKIHEKIGGFDETFFMYCEDVDLSWRARLAGFKVKTCPRALFYHPVGDKAEISEINRRFLHSGITLARKWGSSSFEARLLEDLKKGGFEDDYIPNPPRISGPRGLADFTHLFHFAPVRW